MTVMAGKPRKFPEMEYRTSAAAGLINPSFGQQ
jgi:hypothetical protein